MPVPDELRGEEVKAYVQLRGDARRPVPPEEIVRTARERSSPPFKVPRYIEFRDTRFPAHAVDAGPEARR